MGSTLVAPDGKQLSNLYVLEIAGFITECRRRGKEIILVSSGAVAAGLSTQARHTGGALSIPEKQAMAAIGQPLLISHWSKFFDFPCAQLLLTYQGMRERQRFVNAKNTLTELLYRQVLPIINENDTVVVDELKVGDNDNLAAHVAVLADADLLLICTDIDGLYDSDPRVTANAKHIPTVEKITKNIYKLAGGAGSAQSTGGMRTKIEAAKRVLAAGGMMVIAHGRKTRLSTILQGAGSGTLFKAPGEGLSARSHWIAMTAKVRGYIHVDEGASKAIVMKNASLLPTGITGVKKAFDIGDVVAIIDPGGTEIARGVALYSKNDIQRIKGRHSNEIDDILGYSNGSTVIHRNDMVRK